MTEERRQGKLNLDLPREQVGEQHELELLDVLTRYVREDPDVFKGQQGARE
jgi:hypothetical protein